MRRIILTIVLFYSISIFAQSNQNQKGPKDKFKVEWGKEFKSKNSADAVIGSDGEFTYILKRRKGYSIDKVDENLNLIKNVELKLKHKGVDLTFEEILMFNNKIFLVTSVKDKRKKIKSLFYQTINITLLNTDSDPIKLSEINYDGGSHRNSGSFGFKTSEDESKLLIFYILPHDKGEKEKFGFHVYDNRLGEIWSRNIELPYAEELFKIEHYNIDNTGNIYVLGKLYKEKAKNSRRGKPNYEYRLVSYVQNQEKRIEYKIALPNVFLRDMNVVPLVNGDFRCIGFYSEKSSFNVKGSYVLKIDGKTKEILSSNTYEFTLDFITQNMTARQTKKAKKKKAKGKDVEFYEYDIKDIVVKEDGGIIMIAEQYFIQVVTHTTTNANGGTTTTTTYYYNYNDIIAVSISAEEEIEWARKIPKTQVTANDGGFYSSYYFKVIGDKMYFLYNDNKENLKMVRAGKVANFNKGKKSSVTVCVSMDFEGNIQKTKLFSFEATEVLVRPKVCSELGETEVLIFAQKRKNQRYAKFIIL